jgi:predicted enzyme related to lactoylglutathione lyase
MGRVIYFDIAADDADRAIKFYEGVFGWEIRPAGGLLDYWLVKTGADKEPGINGVLSLREAAWQRITCFVDVESLAETLTMVAAKGGRIVQPKTVIPGVGYIAACKDTEDNVIGIMERSQIAGF